VALRGFALPKFREERIGSHGCILKDNQIMMNLACLCKTMPPPSSCFDAVHITCLPICAFDSPWRSSFSLTEMRHGTEVVGRCCMRGREVAVHTFATGPQTFTPRYSLVHSRVCHFCLQSLRLQLDSFTTQLSRRRPWSEMHCIYSVFERRMLLPRSVSARGTHFACAIKIAEFESK
jgi:hypothetical protein